MSGRLSYDATWINTNVEIKRSYLLTDDEASTETCIKGRLAKETLHG